MQRNHSFHYISKHIEKEVKGSLKRLHVMDSNNRIIKACIEKDEIEKEICKHNIKHFTKAHNTKIYQDKIYVELRDNEIRDKILNS